MNMAVAYQSERDPRYSKSNRVAQAASRSRTKPKARHQAVSAKGMLMMVIVSGMLFCVLVGLVYMKYLIATTQLNINSLTAQIHEASNEQTRLQEQLDNAKSIQVIMDRASQLGMSQPTSDQILYVSFPKQDVGESMALANGN